MAVFGQKFEKSSELAELNRRIDACNSAKWPQYNSHEIDEKIKISPSKIPTIDLLAEKWQKMTKKSKNFRKRFFGRNRFEMVQNVF